MTDETYIFFRLHDSNFYAQVQASLDAARGFPDGLTKQSLRDWDDLEVDSEDTHYMFIDRWRVTAEDAALIEQAVSQGKADILTMEEYEAALLPPEPEPEP